MDIKGFLPFNFGGLDPSISSWENSKVVIIPVGYDFTSSYLPGSRKGPLAIIEASIYMELFDEEINKETAKHIGIHTLPQVEAVASSPKDMIEKVEKIAKKVLTEEKFPVLLGGDHILTLGMIRALKSFFPSFGVLQFDAHADMRNMYQETPYNHACIGRRIYELCPLVQVGIRSMSKEEFDFISENKIPCFYSRQVKTNPQKIIESIIELLPEHVYITFDLDIFDPSIMPSVGTPEPGGLTWFETNDLLRGIIKEKRIIGFDVVELCPQPFNAAPDFLAARLVYRILSYAMI